MSLDLEPDRTALLLLDLQNYGVHPEGYWMTRMPEAVGESVSDEWQDFSMTQILPLIAEIATVADFGESLRRSRM